MKIIKIELDENHPYNNIMLAETNKIEDLKASYFEIKLNNTKHYFKIKKISCSIEKPESFIGEFIEQRMYSYIYSNEDMRILLGKELTKIEDEEIIKEIKERENWL